MAGGIEAGIINVLIGPKLVDGFASTLGNDLDKTLLPVAEKTGAAFSKRLSDGFSKVGKGLTAGVTAPIAAAAGAIVAVGMEIDDAFDGIAVKTGATGKELEGLQQDFRDVAGSVTASFAETGDVIATLNQRLGLTGEELQGVAKQILDLQEVTGEQVDTEGLTKYFNAFGIGADQQQLTIDKLFRVSQETGVGISELANSATAAAGTFDLLGIGADQATSLIGQLDRAGVNSGAFLGALNKAVVASLKGDKGAEQALKDRAKATETLKNAQLDLVVAQQKLQEVQANPKAAKSALILAQNNVKKLESTIATASGQIEVSNKAIADSGSAAALNVGQFVTDTFTQIQDLLAAGDEAAAATLAKDIFGARNFSVILKQIKDGNLDVQALTASLEGADGAVQAAVGSTRDWPQELALIKNEGKLALEPLANVLIPQITAAVKSLTPFFQQLANSFKSLSPETARLIIIVAGIAAAIGPVLVVLAKVITSVNTIIGVVKTLNLTLLLNPWALAAAAAIAAVFLIIKNWDSIKEFFTKVFDSIGKAGAAAFEFIKRNWVNFLAVFSLGLGPAIVAIVKNWDKIKTGFASAVNAIKTTASSVGSAIAKPFTAIGDTIAKVFINLRNGAKTAIDFIARLFQNLPIIIRNAFAAIFKLPGFNIISKIVGSVASIKIPGFADGGEFSGGKPMIVGERGPELMVPKTGGYVLPNNVLTGMAGGGATYNVVINNPVAEPSATSIPAALRRANLLRG
jgi:phage-related minor tail protein